MSDNTKLRRTVVIHKAVYDTILDYLNADETTYDIDYEASGLGVVEVAPSVLVRQIVQEPYASAFVPEAYRFVKSLTGTDRVRFFVVTRNQEFYDLDDDELELRIVLGLMSRGVVFVNTYHNGQLDDEKSTTRH